MIIPASCNFSPISDLGGSLLLIPSHFGTFRLFYFNHHYVRANSSATMEGSQRTASDGVHVAIYPKTSFPTTEEINNMVAMKDSESNKFRLELIIDGVDH